MNLSHAYGMPPSFNEEKLLLEKAIDIGVVHFDCAALYGFGKNEILLGEVLKPFRNKIFLTSKCGMTGVNGKRVIDGRPETIKRTCEQSLKNLQTDVIDLYYLHRWDKQVPIEDSVGALSELVSEGYIKAIGLSEVSVSTLNKAHAIHAIAAVQSEYSLWSRNAELGVLASCEKHNIAYVAFSPLARGFLADLTLAPLEFSEKDIRKSMPRFQETHFQDNQMLLNEYKNICIEAECTPAQLALAWLLQQSTNIHVIPGTTSTVHLEENAASTEVELEVEIVNRLNLLINQNTVSGARYNSVTQAEIDTEEF